MKIAREALIKRLVYNTIKFFKLIDFDVKYLYRRVTEKIPVRIGRIIFVIK